MKINEFEQSELPYTLYLSKYGLSLWFIVKLIAVYGLSHKGVFMFEMY